MRLYRGQKKQDLNLWGGYSLLIKFKYLLLLLAE